MSRAIFPLILATSMVIAVGAGCQQKATSSIPQDTSVTDITPAPAPAPVDQPAQPVQPQQPVVYDSMQTGSTDLSGGATAMGGGNYTIRKGDTLYSIAKTRYGDGKQWQRIAAANPGLEPAKLRVGQSIVIP